MRKIFENLSIWCVTIFGVFVFWAGQGEAEAATRLQFLPGAQNAMTFVKSGGFDGSNDSDFANLFQFMDVPVQDSIIGKGKSIVTESQDFNLVCGEYQKQCQVILKKSERVVMSASNQTMKFEVLGDEADQLTAKFLKSEESLVVEFFTEDRKFHLYGVAGRFVFEASESGF